MSSPLLTQPKELAEYQKKVTNLDEWPSPDIAFYSRQITTLFHPPFTLLSLFNPRIVRASSFLLLIAPSFSSKYT